MMYLPWLAFLFIVLWMIRQGDKAKQEYLRRKAEASASAHEMLPQFGEYLELYREALRGYREASRGPRQGEVQKPVEALGTPKQSQVPTQERTSEWKM